MTIDSLPEDASKPDCAPRLASSVIAQKPDWRPSRFP